jgi:hypothetical protein
MLLEGWLVVGALTVGEIAGMTKLSFAVALDTMDGFTVSTAAGLLFFRIGHGDRFRHSTTNWEKLRGENLRLALGEVIRN